MSVASDSAKRGWVVAAGQYPVSGDVAANGAYIRQQLNEAAEAGADLLLTSEAALSGYAGVDHGGWEGFDWDQLRAETRACAETAGRLGLTLVLGSAHFIAEGIAPTNCLYVFVPDGLGDAELVDRYDKCQLTATDKAFYTAGQHRVVLELGGLKVGLLVCYDICYPEMYAAYRADGVELMLHAFHNAGFPPTDDPEAPYLILDEVKPAWLRARAADNQMWIVAANSSREHSCWGNKVVRPDGSVAEELVAGEPGVLVYRFPDDRLKGWLHNFTPLKLADDTQLWQGPTTDHARYRDRTSPP